MRKHTDLSLEEKQSLHVLIDKGYDNEYIAKQYDITPQSVAAYKAWRTRQ